MAAFYILQVIGLSVGLIAVNAEDVINGWGDGIDWKSFEDGVKVSAELNKPLMLVIHKSWCGACKALKPRFAESEEIKELSKNFVMVNTLDDQEPQGEQFAPDGGYIPRVLFMDPNGIVLTDVVNEKGNAKYKYFYPSADNIVASMKKVAQEDFSAKKNEEL